MFAKVGERGANMLNIYKIRVLCHLYYLYGVSSYTSFTSYLYASFPDFYGETSFCFLTAYSKRFRGSIWCAKIKKLMLSI